MLLKGSAHRSAIVKTIVECEEVQFYWLITQADFDVGDDETYQILLHKIVEAYITIRGNSYASNLMEKHKQATTKRKHSVQRLSVMNFIMKIIDLYQLFIICKMVKV